jgi:putative oxidoreductase
MHHLFSSCGKSSCKSWGLLALRIAIGVIFIMHGYGKLFGDAPGMEKFTMLVTGIGFPLPVVFAYAAALTEFFGGIAMILGLFTRVFSVLLGFVMLVALLGVKKFAFPSADIDVALLSIAIALFCMGAGRFSLDALLFKKSCCGHTGTCDCACCGETKAVTD